MRKLIATEWMSLDGVVQAPSYTDEGRRQSDPSPAPRRESGDDTGAIIATYAATR